MRALATVVHSQGDMGATISSGSFLTEGMVVIPCSVRTLAGIANGYGEHLVHRAADVVLKERRRLVLVVREMPLSEVHLENMLKLARMGVVMLPPMPASTTIRNRLTTWSTTSSAACSTSSRFRPRSPSAGTATCTPPPRSRLSAARRRRRRLENWRQAVRLPNFFKFARCVSLRGGSLNRRAAVPPRMLCLPVSDRNGRSQTVLGRSKSQ